jgi:hypothetical protein
MIPLDEQGVLGTLFSGFCFFSGRMKHLGLILEPLSAPTHTPDGLRRFPTLVAARKRWLAWGRSRSSRGVWGGPLGEAWAFMALV